MIISVDGELIDTDSICRISCLYQDTVRFAAAPDWLNVNSIYFQVYFKDGNSKKISLYAQHLYKDHSIRYLDSNKALYEKRINELKEKVEAVRHSLLVYWSHGAMVPLIDFNLELDNTINLRKTD